MPNDYLRGKILILVETPDGVENSYGLIGDYLKANGCNEVDSYIRYTHHGQTEVERHTLLADFRKNDFCMLITTYRLARAVHIPEVNTAINIHPAKDVNIYRKVISRVGREGKALVCTLFGDEDMELVEQYKHIFNSSKDYSLVIDGEVVHPSEKQEMTCLELLREFEDSYEDNWNLRESKAV